MYRIKPLSVVPDEVDLPKCMYQIKPLNGIEFSGFNGDLGAPTIKRVKMEPELQAIEDRQLEVIAKLKKLRNVVDDMVKNTGGGSARSTSTVSKTLPSSTSRVDSGTTIIAAEAPSEIVIEANPNRPPLSLLFFRQLTPNLRTVGHTHSSCKSEVNQKLATMFNREVDKPCSTVRVVWKNNSGSKLTPPTLGSCSVEGESNVARYLSRVFSKPGTNSLNYDAIPLEDLVLVDSVLESSDRVDNAPDQFFQCLQNYIQKRSGNSKLCRTIADYIGYSTLQYLTKNKLTKVQPQKSIIEWMNCLTNEVPSLS